MNRLALTVTGMSCTGCEQRVSAVLGRLEGVSRAEADHLTGTLLVDFDGATIDEARIMRRLADAGYEPAPNGAAR